MHKVIAAARRNSKILGIFLFGTDRVAEFIRKGFTFVSIGNDLHCILTQAQAHMKTLKTVFPVEMDAAAKSSSQAVKPSSSGTASNVNLAKESKGRGSGPESDESTNLVLAAGAAAVVLVLGVSVWRSRKL
jgi:hypothetical protein